MVGPIIRYRDESVPPEVAALLPKRPACFKSERDWLCYLLDVSRGTLDDRLNRNRLRRGEVPNFCSECSPEYRERERAAGRCHPPYAQSAPTGEVIRDPST